MYKIMVEWINGVRECIDEADTPEDAEYLVEEYMTAFNSVSYNRIWSELKRSS